LRIALQKIGEPRFPEKSKKAWFSTAHRGKEGGKKQNLEEKVQITSPNGVVEKRGKKKKKASPLRSSGEKNPIAYKKAPFRVNKLQGKRAG